MAQFRTLVTFLAFALLTTACTSGAPDPSNLIGTVRIGSGSGPQIPEGGTFNGTTGEVVNIVITPVQDSTITGLNVDAEAGVTVVENGTTGADITIGNTPGDFTVNISLSGTANGQTGTDDFDFVIHATQGQLPTLQLATGLRIDNVLVPRGQSGQYAGARTIPVEVVPAAGAVIDTVTATTQRGTINTFAGLTSNWVMPNTPGTDTITINLTGSLNGTPAQDSFTAVSFTF